MCMITIHRMQAFLFCACLFFYYSIGAKSTNQVLTTIPFIVFVEDCIFVRDVITVYPWVVALEVLGKAVFTLGCVYIIKGKQLKSKSCEFDVRISFAITL